MPTKKMTTIKILAILSPAQTLRIPRITLRSDGTLWARDNTTPLVNSSGTLNADQLRVLVSEKQWDKIPADNYMRLGINPGAKECIDDALLAIIRNSDGYKAALEVRD